MKESLAREVFADGTLEAKEPSVNPLEQENKPEDPNNIIKQLGYNIDIDISISNPIQPVQSIRYNGDFTNIQYI